MEDESPGDIVYRNARLAKRPAREAGFRCQKPDARSQIGRGSRVFQGPRRLVTGTPTSEIRTWVAGFAPGPAAPHLQRGTPETRCQKPDRTRISGLPGTSQARHRNSDVRNPPVGRRLRTETGRSSPSTTDPGNQMPEARSDEDLGSFRDLAGSSPELRRPKSARGSPASHRDRPLLTFGEGRQKPDRTRTRSRCQKPDRTKTRSRCQKPDRTRISGLPGTSQARHGKLVGHPLDGPTSGCDRATAPRRDLVHLPP